MLPLLEFDSAFYEAKQGPNHVNTAQKSSKAENLSLVRDQMASQCWRNSLSTSRELFLGTWQRDISQELLNPSRTSSIPQRMQLHPAKPGSRARREIRKGKRGARQGKKSQRSKRSCTRLCSRHLQALVQLCRVSTELLTPAKAPQELSEERVDSSWQQCKAQEQR